MSREAKIGLLVALAFLLVIGLLLSDHVTNTHREPPAPLVASAEGVRQGMVTPGGRMTDVVIPQPQPKEASRPYVYDPAATPPRNAETASGEIPQLDVSVGHPAQPVGGTPASETGEAVSPEWAGGEAQQPVTDPFADLRDVANAGGEPLEPIDAPQSTPSQQPPSQPATPAGVGVVQVAEYVAQPGDTLSRMARRIFGSDTIENRQKLISLNPQLAENPDLIHVGQSYKIPAGSASATAMTSVEPTEASAPAANTTGERYTVRAGDTLSEISQRQLGTSRRWKEIIALNRDQIDDASDLQVGMVLKLPA